jgi:hypothetical protein
MRGQAAGLFIYKDRYSFYYFAELIFAANAGINEDLGCW